MTEQKKTNENTSSLLAKFPFLSGLVDRYALLIAGYIAASGLFNNIFGTDTAALTEIVKLLILGLLGLAFAWYQNRTSLIVDTAANVEGVKVLAPEAIAKDTGSKDVVSTDDKKLVDKS